MRWIAIVVVVLTAVLAWTTWSSVGSRSGRFSFRLPAGAEANPTDLAVALRDAKTQLLGPKLTLATCSSLLDGVAERLLPERVHGWGDASDKAKFKDQATAWLDELFRVELVLHSRLKGFGPDLAKHDACLLASARTLQALRTLGDSLGETALGFPVEDSDDQPQTLGGSAPYTEVSASAAPLAFKSGDILISRGPGFLAAALGRLSDERSGFSHVEIVYVDPVTQKKWVVGAHVDIGALAEPLETYLDEDRVRVIVLRHPDAALAHRAAEAIFNRVTRYRKEKGTNIAYDYHLDLGDDSALFDAETISVAFGQASGHKMKFPFFAAKIPAGVRSLTDALGIKGERLFEPEDIELDPRFDLIAEWRDFGRVNASHMKDQILNSIFAWMEHEDYRMRQPPKTKASQLRHWPLFSRWIDSHFPATLTEPAIDAISALNETGEALYTHLEQANLEQRRAAKRWMTAKEMTDELEAYRREDLRAYELYQKTHDYDPLAKKPAFHLYFRPGPLLK